MYQAVIVEDDPHIAALNREYLVRDPRFQVTQVFQDGRAALRWLSAHPVDLVVLDLYMPVLTGLELLRELRRQEVACDVIMVTAATDNRTVDALLKLGVMDYLVKPFAYSRFHQALDRFCQHREAISSHPNVSQQDLDALLPTHFCAPSAPPKGLQESTLAHIRTCLHRAPTHGCTSEALSEASGLSCVTVRRYMAYLLEQGEAVSRVNYDTGGRPSLLYLPAKQG